MTDYGHTPVLLQEVIQGLDFKKGDVFLDGTLGSGGHTEAVFKLFGGEISYIGVDADEDAILRSVERLKSIGCDIKTSVSNFRNIENTLKDLEIESVDKVLLDLGFSSNQLEESGRGFSFQKDEPLNMSLSASQDGSMNASDVVNNWSAENLETIIRSYGDEKYARRIVREIVEARKQKPIRTTVELAGIIMNATPKLYHYKKIHPATKTFQALRITVNDEIRALQDSLPQMLKVLNSGGRIAVISFHSLEDRVVKNFFRDWEKEGLVKRINKKPLTASEDEKNLNSRSRSAKLRICEKQ